MRHPPSLQEIIPRDGAECACVCVWGDIGLISKEQIGDWKVDIRNLINASEREPYLVRMGRRGKRVLAEEVEAPEVHHEEFVMNLKSSEKTVLLSCKCYVCIVVNFSKTPPTDELCSKSPTIVTSVQWCTSLNGAVAHGCFTLTRSDDAIF